MVARDEIDSSILLMTPQTIGIPLFRQIMSQHFITNCQHFYVVSGYSTIVYKFFEAKIKKQ